MSVAAAGQGRQQHDLPGQLSKWGTSHLEQSRPATPVQSPPGQLFSVKGNISLKPATASITSTAAATGHYKSTHQRCQHQSKKLHE
jgi:hypothetical protein